MNVGAVTLGATHLGDGKCRFLVWAQACKQVELLLKAPRPRVVTMQALDRGYFQAVVDGVEPGTLYAYRLDGEKERPDPASRYQPKGVHGPSSVVDSAFPWEDAGWHGIPQRDYVIYELHTGTFSREGTFEGVIPHLDYLKDLGITAIELMPISQFPGGRNWGYDGVLPFAAQDSYGGPGGLKRLVNACHMKGLAVVLDVVYNHMGPEGNYLRDFSPRYFTERYHTPWGDAMNFDGPHSDEVRRYFIESALYWTEECHVDGLRLDALHAILDLSARPFLKDLASAVHEQAERLDRRVHLFAESDRNNPALVRSPELGGHGLDGHWADDYHHVVHALLTGERDGYYEDYSGVRQLAKALRDGFVYTGQYSPFRQHSHGDATEGVPAERFVVFSQNHDQIGNRILGERLSKLVSFDSLKVAAGAVVLSPFVPLLFMGEEYGEPAPFQYFISHSDPALVEAVRKGRRQELSRFKWAGNPPDPQAEATFQQCKLDHSLRERGRHMLLLEFYRELLRLRKTIPALAGLSRRDLETAVYEEPRLLGVRRWRDGSQALAAFNFGDTAASIALHAPAARWQKRLDSADPRWQGKGSEAPIQLDSSGEATLPLTPRSFVLYESMED